MCKRAPILQPLQKEQYTSFHFASVLHINFVNDRNTYNEDKTGWTDLKVIKYLHSRKIEACMRHGLTVQRL